MIHIEFIRYVVCGTLAFGCDFLAYIALIEILGLNYLLANVVGFCLGLTVNYYLSIRWVFSQRSVTSIKKEFVLFTGIGLFNLGLGELSLWGLVEWIKADPITGKLIVTALVFLSNFGMRKVMLFRVRRA